MGDRVCVYFRIPTEYKEEVNKLLAGDSGTLDFTEEYNTMGEVPITEFYIDDVNYAEVDQELAILKEHGIPVVYTHDTGGSFDAGTGYVLFNAQGPLEYYWANTAENPSIHTVLEEHSKGEESFLEWATNHKELHRQTITEADVEFGKLYKLKIMLGVTP